jgi:hypothetical protein
VRAGGGFGRLNPISGTVNTRSAGAPSEGQNVSMADAEAGRETSKSSPQTVQR